MIIGVAPAQWHTIAVQSGSNLPQLFDIKHIVHRLKFNLIPAPAAASAIIVQTLSIEIGNST
jgi:hypothetical protein